MRVRVSLAAGAVGVLVLMAVWPGLFAPVGLHECDLARSLDGPDGAHWLGSDLLGCDFWARVVHGVRASLVIAVLGAAGAVVIASLGGLAAGFFGGPLETVVARVTDAWFGIPLIFGGAVALVAVDQRGVRHVVGVLALLSWPIPLRLVRASAASVRQLDYVQAARALGASQARILFRHVAPNALAPLLAYVPVLMGALISAEAVLTYLGYGLQTPTTSLGVLLSEPGDCIRPGGCLLSEPRLTVVPALFVTIAVAAFLVLSDAARSALAVRRS